MKPISKPFFVLEILFGGMVIVCLLLMSCATNVAEQPEKAPVTQHTMKLLAQDAGWTMSLYEIDGCQYIRAGETIIHKANCPNHNYSYMSGEPKQ